MHSSEIWNLENSSVPIAAAPCSYLLVTSFSANPSGKY